LDNKEWTVLFLLTLTQIKINKTYAFVHKNSISRLLKIINIHLNSYNKTVKMKALVYTNVAINFNELIA
jgi:hypothetical protein